MIRPRTMWCVYVWCDTTMIRPRTMWYDYGGVIRRYDHIRCDAITVTVYCSTTLLRLRNDTNATTLEIACPKLKAVIEERWWNRRAWNILIPHFPTFFLVCSEEEDSLWIELFPLLSGREFFSNFMLLRWLCNGYTNSRETSGGKALPRNCCSCHTIPNHVVVKQNMRGLSIF